MSKKHNKGCKQQAPLNHSNPQTVNQPTVNAAAQAKRSWADVVQGVAAPKTAAMAILAALKTPLNAAGKPVVSASNGTAVPMHTSAWSRPANGKGRTMTAFAKKAAPAQKAMSAEMPIPPRRFNQGAQEPGTQGGAAKALVASRVEAQVGSAMAADEAAAKNGEGSQAKFFGQAAETQRSGQAKPWTIAKPAGAPAPPAVETSASNCKDDGNTADESSERQVRFSDASTSSSFRQTGAKPLGTPKPTQAVGQATAETSDLIDVSKSSTLQAVEASQDVTPKPVTVAHVTQQTKKPLESLMTKQQAYETKQKYFDSLNTDIDAIMSQELATALKVHGLTNSQTLYLQEVQVGEYIVVLGSYVFRKSEYMARCKVPIAPIDKNEQLCYLFEGFRFAPVGRWADAYGNFPFKKNYATERSDAISNAKNLATSCHLLRAAISH
jgi:hypothetical protein